MTACDIEPATAQALATTMAGAGSVDYVDMLTGPARPTLTPCTHAAGEGRDYVDTVDIVTVITEIQHILGQNGIDPLTHEQ